MKSFFKHNRFYILIYAVVLIVLGYVLLNHGKVQIHKTINAYVGNQIVDVFFKYFTHVGDGLLTICVILALLFLNARKACYVLLSYISSSLLTAFLKRVIFTDHFRPDFVFKYFVREELHLVNGINMLSSNTFPSGHSTTAFSLFFCLLFMSKNHVRKSVFFCLAFLAAFSRTYISQHWLVDIYVGSMIGFSFSFLYYIIFYHKEFSYKLNPPLPVLLSKNKKRV